MSGWFDDWSEGKVDALTALSSWLDGEKSPSQKADDKCGYEKRDSCWHEKRDEESGKLRRFLT